MTDFKTQDLIVGTGKAAERGALITAHYRAIWRMARCLIHRTVEDSHSSASSVRGA